jgi:quinoprotein glucose dehydrogenase
VTTPRRLAAIFLSGAALIGGAFYLRRTGRITTLLGGPAVGGVPPMPRQVVRSDVPEVRVEEVARNLEVPWAIAFAADGRMFVTERPGRIQVFRGAGARQKYLDVGGVAARGEGGLMGLALHPQFPRVPYLYLMYTASKGGQAVNRISRLRDQGETAGNEEILVDDIAAAPNHDGGALAFGPDGMLYAGTGDGARPKRAQDLASLNGKVLRMTPEGKVAPDNPFPGSFVYAYGLRNVTALAWHPETKELWAASHGPSGEFPGLYYRDTVFIIRKGGNHGWPLVVGTTDRADIVSPVLYYPEAAVPPGGAIFYTGALFPQFRNNYFLASLRAEHLQRVVTEEGWRIAAIERWWPRRYGRLRALAQGPGGELYFSTSNTDGRGQPDAGSDYIFRIVPSGRGQARRTGEVSG